MNYKLEKFWNSNKKVWKCYEYIMNYKLEKFWNLNLPVLSTVTDDNEL